MVSLLGRKPVVVYYALGWVELGQSDDKSVWVGSQKIDPRTTLVYPG